MPVYDFKSIQPIENSKNLVDTILYKTIRKTPTVIRKGFKISRIRSFYMLKVKFTQNSIDSKLSQVLDQFPKIDEIHPFYRYWFNIMYDKDHYKVALGQLGQCRTLVDKVGKHYVKLLKHADSLFQCKSLKVSALGRMVSLLRKMNPYLEFLEQIRQHMGRLPAIDPSTRSVVLTGYPSTGKSSYLNTVTRANVDVQPWAFTTQSLLIGHSHHRGIRFQIIDSPGLLDHAPEERNVIELQTVTALAYLNSAVVFVMDVTQGAAFVEKQVNLYNSLKPFYNNKPLIIVLSKMDLWTPKELTESESAMIQSMSPNFPLQYAFQLAEVDCSDQEQILQAQNQGGEAAVKMIQLIQQEQQLRNEIIGKGCVPFLCVSAQTRCGVERSVAIVCDMLLQIRQAQSSQQKSTEITGTGTAAIPGLFVAQPRQRDDIKRPPMVPASVQALNELMLHPRPHGPTDGFKTELEKQNEVGGCTNYTLDPRKYWLGINEEERHDQIAYIHNGKNIIDFVTNDYDIDQVIQQLEEEEKQIEQQNQGVNDAELFARLAAFEKIVCHRPSRHKILKRIVDKHQELQYLKNAPKKTGIDLPESDVTRAVKPMAERLLEEAKNAVSLDAIRREFKKRRHDRENAFHQLQPHVSAPKHLMTGKTTNQTRDWR